MKTAFCLLFGTLSGLLGLVALVNLFYNLDGFAGGQDGASGSKIEAGLAVLLFASVTFRRFLALLLHVATGGCTSQVITLVPTAAGGPRHGTCWLNQDRAGVGAHDHTRLP